MDTFLQQFINGLSLGAIYALIALGYTMVYGVLRLINFAHGDVYMLGAFAGYYLANSLNLDANPSVLGAVVVTIGAMAIAAAIGDRHRAVRVPAGPAPFAPDVADYGHRRVAAAGVRRTGRFRRDAAVLSADDHARRPIRSAAFRLPTRA